MPLIIQPSTPTIAALSDALSPSATAFDAAVAYVTFGGVTELMEHSTLKRMPKTAKRFMIGIDWFRSEPSAIDALGHLSPSSVKIVDGAYLVATPNCQPRQTFHPKAYSVTDKTSTLIVGSANLSANGLRRSKELSISTSDSALRASFLDWFESEWGKATPWAKIRTDYIAKYGPARKKEFVVTEDDDTPDSSVFRIRWVTSERLRLIRTAQNLWVDVGHLHNRDPQGLPGTDLQFSQMTRVFFGREPIVVPGNTHLGDVRLSMKATTPEVRPMVFNKSSSMDRLSLPVPGEGGWPPSYDDKTLLFTKFEDGSYRVTMATGADRADWRRRSGSLGFVVEMTRGLREWGVF